MSDKWSKLLLFLFLYCSIVIINYLILGLSIKGGLYLDIINNYNYHNILRRWILELAVKILDCFWYTKAEIFTHDLVINNGKHIRMVYSCIGTSIMSAWISFVLSYINKCLFKTIYIIVGTAIVIILNSLRVALLSVVSIQFDHHLFYNIVVYIVVFVMMLVSLHTQNKSKV
jgi:hypothetical protein